MANTKVWIIGVLVIWAFALGIYNLNLESSNDDKLVIPDQKIMSSQIVNLEKNATDSFSKTDRLHWGHMPITYKIEETCRDRLKNLSRLAFAKIENETSGQVKFAEVSSNPDIAVYCKSQQIPGEFEDLAIAEAGYDTDNFNSKLIIHGEIYIYNQGMVCNTGYPALETHEILHLFGFEHNPETGSIMDPYAAESSNRCSIKRIDYPYINCLKNIYSNGTIEGNCSKISTIITTSNNKDNTECAYGWYPVTGTKFCCPEPNMKIVEGYCT